MKVNNWRLEKLYRRDLPGNFNEFDLVKNQWDRIVHLFEEDKLPPHEFIIHPTCICNLRCRWCIGQNVETGCIENEKVEEKLSIPNNMLRVLNNIVSYKKRIGTNPGESSKVYRVNNISFSGLIGEPLVAKESVLRGMEYLINNGIRTGIFTNGLLIDNECIDVLANINYVLISLDAAENDTYNFMKCGGLSKEKNVDKVLQSISGPHDAKRKLHTNLDINIGYVVNEFNYNEIFLAAQKVKQVGVHYFRLKFDIAINYKLTKDQLDVVRNQIRTVHEELEDDYFKLIEIHRMSEIIDSDQKRLFSKCWINKIYAAVGPDAYLYACNYHAKQGGIKHLSLLDHDFSDIWTSFDHSDVSKCPGVCDPYKNRANNMLNVLYDIYRESGIEDLEKYRKEWIDE